VAGSEVVLEEVKVAEGEVVVEASVAVQVKVGASEQEVV
jgi:hypothetical protein